MKKIPLFHPYVSQAMKKAAFEALGGKIIGQGQKVDEFEKKLAAILGSNNLVTVNSGTSALELAYHILELRPGDEVICPVFTFAATNVPLLRRSVKVVFADVKDDLMLDWEDAQNKVTAKTRAIINVHLAGRLNETKKLNIPIVGDAAQYLGKTSGEKFTAYSFQATKPMTTVDGGVLICQSPADYQRAKLLRWYGIDRQTGRDSVEVDIVEAGFKYHMNDVTASIGLAGLSELNAIRRHLESLQQRYQELLGGPPGGSPYLVHAKNRPKLVAKLARNGVEAGLMLRRNDTYTIFGGKRQNLPNMNRLEDSYLFLPCHNHMSLKDVEFICGIAKEYL